MPEDISEHRKNSNTSDSNCPIDVTCAIIEKKGQVLAAQRGPGMAMPFKWEFPGGKINPGETAEEGIIREIKDILAALGKTTLKEFSPSTMYADFPISRDLLHWESQSNTRQNTNTGQNLIHHIQRGYTILIFARSHKKQNNCTVPFTYLGPATCQSHQGERPIQMVWKLEHSMPAEMFEDNRKGG